MGSDPTVSKHWCRTWHFNAWGLRLRQNITRVNSHKMISTFRTSDFQISGSAISSHKNKLLIIPGLSEPPVRTLRATIPENGSHIFRVIEVTLESLGGWKKSSPKSFAWSFSFLPLTGFLRMPYGADPRSSPGGLAGVRKVTQKEGHILIIKKLLFSFCVLVSNRLSWPQWCLTPLWSHIFSVPAE